MKRSASVRFDNVLASSERESAARTLRSAGATVTSWNEAAGNTYAALSVEPHAAFDAIARSVVGGRIDAPPLAVLRITPATSALLSSLAEALGGAGRPRGVLDLRREERALILELQPQTTPLTLVVALIDVELTHFPGRSIEPLLPLDDATLAAFAGDLLGEPDLDAARLIETHLEPLLVTTTPGGFR